MVNLLIKVYAIIKSWCVHVHMYIHTVYTVHVSMHICVHYIALKEAIAKNDEKLQAGNATDKTQYALGWTIDELSHINEECPLLYVETTTLMEHLVDDSTDIVTLNCARSLNSLQGRLQAFLSSVSRYKRTAASHVLVTMISPDARNKKPYAVPVSFVPYTSLTEVQGRRLINEVVKEMNERGMSVADIYIVATDLRVHVCICYVSGYV